MRCEIFKRQFENLDWLKKVHRNEFINILRGRARFRMVCDWSGEAIAQGEDVIAISMGRGVGPKRVTWEVAFIDPDGGIYAELETR